MVEMMVAKKVAEKGVSLVDKKDAGKVDKKAVVMVASLAEM